jgi:hypothetical protein
MLLEHSSAAPRADSRKRLVRTMLRFQALHLNASVDECRPTGLSGPRSSGS